MAADVARHLVLAEFLLDELHRREDRPLRAAGAEARRPHRHLLLQFLEVLVDVGGRLVRRAQEVGQKARRVGAEERGDAVGEHLRGVLAGHRQRPLADDLRADSALRRIFASACSM